MIRKFNDCKHRKYIFYIKCAKSTCLLTNEGCKCFMPPRSIEVARALGCTNDECEIITRYNIKVRRDICVGCDKCGEYID